MQHANVDAAEVAKFEELAHRWWDPQSEFKPLHEINPLRLGYIEQHAGLSGQRIVDIGCGGGILSESMAAKGANVLGIDMGETPLSVAKLHKLESGVEVEYRQCTAEKLAEEMPNSFDVVTCMEMLEHVPDPASVIKACATLVKPGGKVFFSTINRNMKAYLFAIVGAEYILQMLPKGTHDYAKFIRPSEMEYDYAKFIRPSEMESWARDAKLKFTDMKGMTYNPITKNYTLGSDVNVNYLVCCDTE